MEPTFDQALERFLGQMAAAQGRSFAPNTLAAYRRDLRQFRGFIMAHGMVAWQEETAPLVDFRQWLRDREFAPATQARKLAAVRSFYAFLAREGLIQQNPAVALSGPHVNQSPPHTIAADDVGALLAAAGDGHSSESLRDRAMLSLLCATGLRASEMVALDVGDVDLVARTVTCARPRRSTTVLTYDDQVAEALGTYLTDGRPHLIRAGSEAALFLNHRGGRLTRQGFWLIVKAAARAAGIEGSVTPRTLRHTVAAGVVDQSRDIAKVEAHLGHGSRPGVQVHAPVAAVDGSASARATVATDNDHGE